MAWKLLKEALDETVTKARMLTENSNELATYIKDPDIKRWTERMLGTPSTEMLGFAVGIGETKQVYNYLGKLLDNNPLITPKLEETLTGLLKRIEDEFAERGWNLTKGFEGSKYVDRIYEAKKNVDIIDPGAKNMAVMDMLPYYLHGLPPVEKFIDAKVFGTLMFVKGRWVPRYSSYKPSEPFTAIDKMREAGADMGWLTYNWGEKIE